MTIGIVELPPDLVDEVSHFDDLDENMLEDTLPTDVPVTLEAHTTQENKYSKQGSDHHIKKIKTNITSNWTAADATYSKSFSDPTEIERRKNNLVATVKGKSAVECFQELLMKYWTCLTQSVWCAKKRIITALSFQMNA